MGHASIVGASGALRRLVVVSYNSSINSNLVSSQLKMGKSVSSRRVSQGSISITIQTRGIAEQKSIVDFVRKHQVDSITKDGSEVRFLYPSQKMDYLGFIRGVSYTHRTEDFAPQISLEFLLVRDLINTKTTSSSYGGDFDDFFATSMDFDEEEFIPPASGDHSSRGIGAASGVQENVFENMSGSAEARR